MKAHLIGIAEDRAVIINGKDLDPGPSQKVVNHSPDGFNCGYSGSGPAQLALAVLLEILGEERAREHYHELKSDWIAALDQGKDFELKLFIEADPDGLRISRV